MSVKDRHSGRLYSKSWDLKKELRQELKAERAARADLIRERFGKAKLPLAEPADIGLPGTGLRVEVESKV
jgi:hypothetical protein